MDRALLATSRRRSPRVDRLLRQEEARSGRLNTLVLAFVFIVPFLPPPTTTGAMRFVTPAIMVPGALYLFTHRSLAWNRINRHTSRIPQLGKWMAAALAIYGLRIALDQAWGDTEHYLSRVLLVVALVAFLRWLEVTTVDVRQVILVFLAGYLALSVLIVFTGVTGTSIFGQIAPSRGWLGSFVKTTGVPRSSGEVGIMACFAWAAFLVYGQSLRPSFRIATGLLIPWSLLVVQSRNVVLAFLVVTLAWFFSRHEATVSVLLVALAFVSPLVVEAALPTIQANELGSGLIGEDIYERNVYTRFELFDSGFDFIGEDPLQSVLGRSRGEWEDYLESQAALPKSVHNHFLASIINLGFIAGAISIVALFALPLFRLASKSRRLSADGRAVFLAALGAVVSLSFYEGFFSPTLMIIWALMWYEAFVRVQPSGMRAGR